MNEREMKSCKMTICLFVSPCMFVCVWVCVYVLFTSKHCMGRMLTHTWVHPPETGPNTWENPGKTQETQNGGLIVVSIQTPPPPRKPGGGDIPPLLPNNVNLLVIPISCVQKYPLIGSCHILYSGQYSHRYMDR